MPTLQLKQEGVELLVLDQAIDTSTPTGRLLFSMLGAIAEFETELRRAAGALIPELMRSYGDSKATVYRAFRAEQTAVPAAPFAGDRDPAGKGRTRRCAPRWRRLVMTMSLRSCYPSSKDDSLMRSVRDQPPKREILNLRIKAGERGLIDRAARASGKARTDFILDAARRAAEQTLIEQALIRVGPEAFDAFLARLDAPPAPNERLRRTMRTPPPWERE